ncbi:MAG TPA: hypothetical protein VFO29_02805 [Candidatus Rubrimentiphilum sp.]|nr:hypothetical protein [Candidatus Rubrimentiphilum sp.]
MAISAFALVALLLQVANAPAPHCDASRIFSQVRTATGGNHWNTVGEIVADGTITDSGAVGSVHSARDVVAGRNLFAEALDQGRVSYIYDGHTKWELDQGLGVHAMNAPDSIRRAVTDAYLARNGFWKPNDPARVECLSGVSANGASFDVVRITPRDGSAVEVWIDRATHLVARTIQQLPTTLRTELYADYRKAGGLVLPYSITQQFLDGYGKPAVIAQSIKQYRLLPAVRAADFRRPPDPVNGRIAGGASSTQVPFTLDKGVIVFQARINGQGPFAFTFDPGAQGVLTSVAAVRLGLTPGKMANVGRLEVGGAEIDNIALPVYAGNPTDLFPARDPNAAPIAGALGPELLDRFVVRLDYAAKTLTLTPMTGSTSAPTGTTQRFTLQEDDDIPLIPAAIDGVPGLVQFDVRAPAPLLLFRHPAGTGTVQSLKLGGVELHDVPARFTDAQAGKFSSRTEAGLIGSRVLSQFVTTLNYRAQTIRFEYRPIP